MTTSTITRPAVQTLISHKEAARRCAVSRATLYRFMADGSFPKPIRLSPGRVAFVEHEIQAWIDAKIAGSRNAA